MHNITVKITEVYRSAAPPLQQPYLPYVLARWRSKCVFQCFLLGRQWQTCM